MTILGIGVDVVDLERLAVSISIVATTCVVDQC
jgi:phosphopantetheinyl transferase (holo-ACP synthase)